MAGSGGRVVRCAVVGLDSAFWPSAFRQAILDHPNTSLAGMCGAGVPPEVIQRDFVAPVDEWLAERGERRIDTIDELLERDVDAAFLCSRNTSMPALAKRLLDAGVHLFVAKPMAVSVEGATAYLAAKERGLVVTAGQLASTWEPWPTIRRIVAEDRVGTVVTARAVHQHGDFALFPPQLWYADPAEGDACNWLGWYPVEAIVSLLGPVGRVHGVARQAASAHGGQPDTVTALLELVDGRHAAAAAHLTIGDWGMAFHEAEVVGERGIVRYRGPGSAVQVLTGAGEVLVPFEPGDGLRTEVDAFVRAVRGEAAPCIDVDIAVHVASVCASWRASAASGAPVTIPVPPPGM